MRGGLACYGVSLLLWLGALSRLPVSVAYPMLSVGYVVNAAAAAFLFGEALTMQKITGIALISVGVVVLSLHGLRNQPNARAGTPPEINRSSRAAQRLLLDEERPLDK